jgi:hypothetical protein
MNAITTSSSRRWLGLAAAMFVAATGHSRAMDTSLSSVDLDRAVALARWPHSDAERVRFHDRYLTIVHPDLSPVSPVPAVIQIDVVTEFRRAELLTEEHERFGDSSFARGGLADAKAAIAPWRGRVAVDVHLQLPGGCGPDSSLPGCAPVIPPTDITLEGVGVVRATQALRPFWYARSGSSPLPLGNVAEAMFDATAIGSTPRDVRVIVDGKELARVTIDFGGFE